MTCDSGIGLGVGYKMRQTQEQKKWEDSDDETVRSCCGGCDPQALASWGLPGRLLLFFCCSCCCSAPPPPLPRGP